MISYATHLLSDVLCLRVQSYLDGEAYEAGKCATMSMLLSEVIRDRIKALRQRRHKVVCSVVIGENGGQALRHASRCLSNADCDSFASSSYTNNSLFAVATVYAVYHD